MNGNVAPINVTKLFFLQAFKNRFVHFRANVMREFSPCARSNLVRRNIRWLRGNSYTDRRFH